MGRILVAPLGVGKGTWGHLARLISDEEWDKIILVSNEWGRGIFESSKSDITDWIEINNRGGFEIIVDQIEEQLPDRDITLSLISGSGKEHMAVLTAIQKKKIKCELVILTGDGVKYYGGDLFGGRKTSD